jgi:hypothetical protein
VIDRDDGYWEIPDGLDTSEFDFQWRPDPYDPPLIHQFGTQHQPTGGPRYIIPDYEGTKYYEFPYAKRLPHPDDRNWRPLVPNATMDFSWHPDENEPPFIYVFGNQWHDDMPTYQYRVKGATQKKFITNIKATTLPNPDNFEVLIDDEVDFDFSWVPSHYEPPMNFVFGNQWHDSKSMPTLKYKGTLSDTKYMDNMFATIKPNKKKFRELEKVSDFDCSWRPNPNDPPFNYIFGCEYYSPEVLPTVLYRVPSAIETKYIYDVKATLRVDKVPFVDSIYDAVMEYDFDCRYVHFQNTQHPIDYKMFIPNQDEKLYVHVIDNSAAIVPKGVKKHLYDKLTDYPYVKHHQLMGYVKPLDIIFFSNGEACADENYQALLDLNVPNRIVRIDGVKGRVASQYAAANASETSWYFLVNSKLRINKDFDFNWQPNIMQSRRHYIFRAKNSINGLEYGHMAMVANNKKLTLETKGTGLDFTMESPHEVVNILSGTAVFNSDWDVWRTAFRESIKLCHATDEISKERLEIWSTVGEGEFAKSSIQGSKDAIEYYSSVNGDLNQLMNSYDWEWLRGFYDDKY